LRSSIALAYNDGHLVIDVGPDFRQQMLRLDVQRLHGILLTHEHNDHVVGLDDIRPFNFKQGGRLPLFSLERVASDIQKRFEYVFAQSRYPGSPKVDLKKLVPFQAFEVQQLKIIPLLIHHGHLDILGFKFGSFAYITDASHIPDRSLTLLKNCSVVVLNALHLKPHHSHFNLKQAVDLAKRLGVPQTYLTHVSHSMGRHSDVNAQLPPHIQLAYDGLHVDLF
jgi:phosphoribosyl 1,2-cyclic phosphate phosphodiesterase